MSFLLFAGCHVFETAVVNCTSDMPCAKAVDSGGTDTADSGGGETGDTGPVGDPSVGWVTSMTGGGDGVVRVFDPMTGEVADEWSGFGEIKGVAYYEPETGTGLLVSVDGVYELRRNGSAVLQSSGPANEKFDVSHIGNHFLGAYQGGLTELSADGSVNEQPVAPGTLTEIKYVGGNKNLAYYVDPSSGGPDLWRLDGDRLAQLVAKDYDTSLTRATNVFVGPDDTPFGCSSAGAIYDVMGLADGKTQPFVYVDEGLSDVSDCAYDSANETFLVYSATKGVLRVDKYGHGTWVFTPSVGFEYARVYWYGN